MPIWRYGVFAAVSYLMLLLLFALLVWSAKRSGLDRAGTGAFTALLAGCFSITFLTNIVGYYDVLMIVLVLLVFQFREGLWQLAAAGGAGVIGVLVHESYVLTVLPVSLAGSVCWAADRERGSARRWIGVGAALLIPLAVFLGVTRQRFSDQQVTALRTAIRVRVNFTVYDPLFHVLQETPDSSWRYMHGLYSAGIWWLHEALALLVFLPVALYFLAIAWRESQGRLVKTWLVLSTFWPLQLNLIVYDQYRWLNLIAVNGILCAIGVLWFRERHRSTVAAFGIRWRRAAVLLLAVNMATSVGFFHGRARMFPFVNVFNRYHSTRIEHRPFFQIP